MKILHSEFNFFGKRFSGSALSWMMALGIIILLGLVYLVYVVLRFVFAQNFILGLFLIFFGLPALGRFLFVSLLTLLSKTIPKNDFDKDEPQQDSSEEIIDVNYRVMDEE